MVKPPFPMKKRRKVVKRSNTSPDMKRRKVFTTGTRRLSLSKLPFPSSPLKRKSLLNPREKISTRPSTASMLRLKLPRTRDTQRSSKSATETSPTRLNCPTSLLLSTLNWRNSSNYKRSRRLNTMLPRLNSPRSRNLVKLSSREVKTLEIRWRSWCLLTSSKKDSTNWSGNNKTKSWAINKKRESSKKSTN